MCLSQNGENRLIGISYDCAVLISIISTNKQYPNCFTKSFHFTAFDTPFLEYDCSAVGGEATIYQTYNQKNVGTVTVATPVIITVPADTTVDAQVSSSSKHIALAVKSMVRHFLTNTI